MSSETSQKRPPVSATLGRSDIARGIFWSIVSSVVCGSLAVMGVIHEYEAFVAARTWTPTDCTVVHADYSRSDQGRNGQWKLTVSYKYEYGGRTYVGDRYSFTSVSHDNHVSELAEMAAALTAQPATMCYVNPANPAESVIHPKALGWLALPGILFALGLPNLLAAMTTWDIVQRRRGVMDPSHVKTDLPLPEYSAERVRFGKRVRRQIRPSAGAILFFAGLLALALSGLAWFVWWQHRTGGQLARAIVLTSGGLVGVAVAMHRIRRAGINDRISLDVPEAVELGDTFEVAWRLANRDDSVRRLIILLEGVESVRHRGRRSGRERRFAALPVIEATHLEQIASGERSVTIPWDTMHSLESDHNHIVWRLRVEGKTVRPPRLNVTFPIVVLPQGVAAREPA